MRLDQYLVLKGLCASRQEAQKCISEGYVLVDGQISLKQTKQVEDTAQVVLTQRPKFVSRGGEKLEGALSHVYMNDSAIANFLANKQVLDIGSSTGGFTDCVLQFGAAHVTSIDVGTLQFHNSLRNDPRITLLENTDIRNYQTDQKFDVIVADLSFISMLKILDTVISFARSGTEFFLLIKPQFEVGFGNTKKGIVKDGDLIEALLQETKSAALSRNLYDTQIFPCIIQGGGGNQEYFLYAKK